MYITDITRIFCARSAARYTYTRDNTARDITLSSVHVVSPIVTTRSVSGNVYSRISEQYLIDTAGVLFRLLYNYVNNNRRGITGN